MESDDSEEVPLSQNESLTPASTISSGTDSGSSSISGGGGTATTAATTTPLVPPSPVTRGPKEPRPPIKQ